MMNNHWWSRRAAIFLLAPLLFFLTGSHERGASCLTHEQVGPPRHKYSAASSFPSYKGLIMAGYQGWFNAPGDGAGMGWNHYARGGKFEPGFCKIDLWPEVGEYAKK
jgi:hypothetical protein